MCWRAGAALTRRARAPAHGAELLRAARPTSPRRATTSRINRYKEVVHEVVRAPRAEGDSCRAGEAGGGDSGGGCRSWRGCWNECPPLSAIGEHVDRVSSWTPERDDPDGVFTYVDLSAVDQDAKVMAGT
jgi:hypothetical protein